MHETTEQRGTTQKRVVSRRRHPELRGSCQAPEAAGPGAAWRRSAAGAGTAHIPWGIRGASSRGVRRKAATRRPPGSVRRSGGSPGRSTRRTTGAPTRRRGPGAWRPPGAGATRRGSGGRSAARTDGWTTGSRPPDPSWSSSWAPSCSAGRTPAVTGATASTGGSASVAREGVTFALCVGGMFRKNTGGRSGGAGRQGRRAMIQPYTTLRSEGERLLLPRRRRQQGRGRRQGRRTTIERNPPFPSRPLPGDFSPAALPPPPSEERGAPHGSGEGERLRSGVGWVPGSAWRARERPEARSPAAEVSAAAWGGGGGEAA